MTDTLSIVISGVFLLIIVQCGGYISELLTCKLQLMLTINKIYKQIVLLIVILTVLMLADTNYEKTPLEHIKFTGLIYMTFILFIKMNLKYTLVTVLILLFIFILTHYIEYLKKIKDETNEKKELINYLFNFKNAFLYLTLLLIFVGFIKYFTEKRVEYSKNWSIIKFLFQHDKCKSLKNI